MQAKSPNRSADLRHDMNLELAAGEEPVAVRDPLPCDLGGGANPAAWRRRASSVMLAEAGAGHGVGGSVPSESAAENSPFGGRVSDGCVRYAVGRSG